MSQARYYKKTKIEHKIINGKQNINLKYFYNTKTGHESSYLLCWVRPAQLINMADITSQINRRGRKDSFAAHVISFMMIFRFLQ